MCVCGIKAYKVYRKVSIPTLFLSLLRSNYTNQSLCEHKEGSTVILVLGLGRTQGIGGSHSLKDKSLSVFKAIIGS